MIKVHIVEDTDTVDPQTLSEADILIWVNSTSVDDVADPDIKGTVTNRLVQMRQDMAELIAKRLVDMVGV